MFCDHRAEHLAGSGNAGCELGVVGRREVGAGDPTRLLRLLTNRERLVQLVAFRKSHLDDVG